MGMQAVQCVRPPVRQLLRSRYVHVHGACSAACPSLACAHHSWWLNWQGANRQWGSRAQCLLDCSFFPYNRTLVGTPQETSGNSEQCRFYHTGQILVVLCPIDLILGMCRPRDDVVQDSALPARGRVRRRGWVACLRPALRTLLRCHDGGAPYFLHSLLAGFCVRRAWSEAAIVHVVRDRRATRLATVTRRGERAHQFSRIVGLPSSLVSALQGGLSARVLVLSVRERGASLGGQEQPRVPHHARWYSQLSVSHAWVPFMLIGWLPGCRPRLAQLHGEGHSLPVRRGRW